MSIYPLNRLIARVVGKVPLRGVLIFPFVLQIVGTVGLVGYLSYKSGQKAVNGLGNQLINEVGDRVDHYLNTYLSTPQLINRINVDAIREGTLNLQDLPKLERHMFVQLLQFNSVTSIVIGNERGDFRALSNYVQLHLLRSDPSNTSQIYYYTLDSNGKIIGLFRTFQQPDVRQRPWYRVAQEAKKPVWSPIFPFGDNSGLAINLSHPIYDQTTNKFLGVVSVNLGISNISEFLNNCKVGKTGEVLIIDRKGLLVASSTIDRPYITNNQKKLERLDVANSSQDLIKSTGQYLRKQFGDFTKIKNKQQLEFIKDGKRQFVQISPSTDEYGLDWLIVVVVPESDFMEQINANTRTTILLCIAALIGAIVIGILTARWITKPILRLNTAARDIAKGQWEKTVEIERFDEVGELAESFNSMAAQLQKSFAELQSLNEALVQSESRLHQILEAMPVGVSVHDLTGQIIYTNQTSRQLLGIEALPDAETEQLAQAYHVYQAGSEQLYPVKNMPVVRSLQGEKARIEDMEIRLPDKTIPLEVYSTPLFDETGKIVAAIAAFQDITERKQAQKLLTDYNRTLETQVTERTKALQQALLAAEVANHAKSAFLANMSHELRTPLNGILGYAQILQRDSNSTPKQKKGIEVIYQCGKHLLTLINDILDLSKIEAGKIELHPEDIHFPSFLTSVCEIFRLKAAQKSIHFTYLPLNQLPTTIHVDEKRLRQVLLNLLSNAVKFTDAGSVTFKVGVIVNERNLTPLPYQERGELDIPLLGEGSNRQSLPNPQSPTTNNQQQITKIRFQIEDTGIGITSEQLEKIFLPFEQVGDVLRRAEGTGLGLSITQKLIFLMGGKIIVESIPGIGSKFWFDLNLPASSNSIQSTSVKSTNTIIGYEGKKQKILLIDDRWDNCSVLINILEPLGFELEEAENGQEGLEKAVEFQPNLIITDLMMSVMNGFEMTQQLRQLPEFRNTIIIATSASVFADDQEKSRESGCQDFLPKPVQIEELLDKIKHHLNLSWLYDNHSETRSQEIEDQSSHSPQFTPKEMVIPPREELIALYEAANIGAVKEVEQEIIRLQQLNPDYTPFVSKVMEMSENFDYEEIVEFLGMGNG